MNFDPVIAVKNRSHRSWINLKNGALKELGQPYYFGTPKVEASSLAYLRTAVNESGLTVLEILKEIERRNLA